MSGKSTERTDRCIACNQRHDVDMAGSQQQQRPGVNAGLDGPWSPILRELARLETANGDGSIGVEIYRQAVRIHKEFTEAYFYNTLATLVDEGYVTRTEHDGRSNRYQLTDAGRTLLRQEAQWLASEADWLATAIDEPVGQNGNGSEYELEQGLIR